MTDTSSLRAFIEARLKEDQEIVEIITAGGYAPPEWRVVNGGDRSWFEIRAFDRANNEPPEAACDEGGNPVALVDGGRNEHVHIARHDPARVLREVAAKRAILAELDAAFGACLGSDGGDSRCEPPDDDRIVRLLASVWSDHPDFRTEWSTA